MSFDSREYLCQMLALIEAYLGSGVKTLKHFPKMSQTCRIVQGKVTKT